MCRENNEELRDFEAVPDFETEDNDNVENVLFATLANIMDDETFIENFHINRNTFLYLLSKMHEIYDPNPADDTVYVEIMLIRGLSFLAKGLYVGEMESAEDTLYFETFLRLMIDHIAKEWISLNYSAAEKRHANEYFETNYGVSEVVGCLSIVDIKLVAEDQYLRSVVVCDYKKRFRLVRLYVGAPLSNNLVYISSETPLLLSVSRTRLADDPYLVLPYKNSTSQRSEENSQYLATNSNNTVTSAMTDLKNRFRCLSAGLPFDSKQIEQILVACCVINNICIHYLADRFA